jgi:hypothetical protein
MSPILQGSSDTHQGVMCRMKLAWIWQGFRRDLAGIWGIATKRAKNSSNSTESLVFSLADLRRRVNDIRLGC